MKFTATAKCLLFLVIGCSHIIAQDPSAVLVDCSGDSSKQIVRVSNGVAHNLVVSAKPFIDQSLAANEKSRITKHVELQARIGTDGVVRCATLIQGEPTLSRGSLEVIHQMRFRPYMVNRQPVVVEVMLLVKEKKGKFEAEWRQ